MDPLVAVIVSVTVLGEPVTAPQLAGGALILGFTLWNELPEKNKKGDGLQNRFPFSFSEADGDGADLGSGRHAHIRPEETDARGHDAVHRPHAETAAGILPK